MRSRSTAACRGHHPEVLFSVKIGFDLIADLRVQLNIVRLPVAVAQRGLEARPGDTRQSRKPDQ